MKNLILLILFFLPVLVYGQMEIAGKSIDFEDTDTDYIYCDFDYDYADDRFGCISAWIKPESPGTGYRQSLISGRDQRTHI